MKSFPLILASLVAILHPAPAADPNPDSAALDRLKLALAATRGINGLPPPSATSPPVADPRAEALARRLRERRLNAAALPAAPPPGPQSPAPPPLPGQATNSGPTDRRSRQLAAFRQLFAGANPAVQLHVRPENHTVRQLRGPLLAPVRSRLAAASATQRDADTARALLRSAAELLGIADPDAELVLDRTEPDGLGGRHLRFTQSWRDLRVSPSTLSVHLDPQGRATLVEGAYVPSPTETAITPRIPDVDALLRGRASVPGGMRGEAGPPELLIHAPLGGEPRLAWSFDLNIGLAQAWRILVDAIDGRILQRQNRVLDANVRGSGIDLSGTARPLDVWQAGGTHYLIDSSKPMFQAGSDPLKTPAGTITIGDARLRRVNELQASEVFHVTSANPALWDVPDGVSAAYNFSQTYDYFLADHVRNSLDGTGGNITAIVRVGEYDNASWNGNLRIMLFGSVKPYADAIDVVGHELTHGLTESSAGLVYENESGALNESFSDIFGEMVEAHATGGLDWKMGTRLGQVFRDLREPGSLIIGGLNRPYPARMSEFIRLPNTADSDHGGVHINSSIPNHCFWQLAEGLPGAIGRHDAARIFFRTLTQHLQPQSQFVDARLGAIVAAEALFGASSPQARATAAAFDAVEILAAPETPEPPSLPIVQAPDSTLFVAPDPSFGDSALYRKEDALGDPAFGELFSLDVQTGRPAVSGDGSEVLYVSGDFDLCYTETADPGAGGCLGLVGEVQSVAISPDGTHGAFVFRNPLTGQAENRITILDLAAGTSSTHELLAPVIDGVPIDAVLYADSMVFGTDSLVLYYDAVSRLRFGSGPAVERWSIYALHLGTAKISIVVPPIEGIDTGNPNMGRAGTRHMVFDALVASTGSSIILGLDLFTGNAAELGLTDRGLGYPCFTGDESAIVYAQNDPNASTTGFSLVHQVLTSDRLGTQGAPTLWMSDARLGVLYRRGAFTGSNTSPTVAITFPSSGATLVPRTATRIDVQATDPDGTVARVEFFDGDDRLGEDTSAPFQLAWTPDAAGTHRIIARAFDNLGAAQDSPAVTVTVAVGPVDPVEPVRLSVALLPDSQLRLTLRGSPGPWTLSRSTDLRQWIILGTVTLPESGEAAVHEPATDTGPAVFYRASQP